MAASLLALVSVNSTEKADVGSRTLIKSVTAVAVVALALLIWYGRLIFIIGALGLLVGLVISFAAGFLEKHGWKRPIAVAVIVLAALGLVGLGAWSLGPTLREQGRALREQIPQVIQTINERLAGTPLLDPSGQAAGAGQPMPQQPDGTQQQQASPQERGAAQNQPAPAMQGEQAGESSDEGSSPADLIRENVGRILGPAVEMIFPVLSTIAEILTALVIILFVAIFFAAGPDRYRRGMLKLFPREHRDRASEVMDEVGDAMGRWMIARLIAMVVVGTVTGVTLAIIGVPSAVALGALAGVLEFVPFFGPILAAIPGVGIALLEGPDKALMALAAYVVIQQLEGALLTPLLLQNRVDVPPLLTILAVPLLTMVAGVAAVLIAEPLLALGIVLVRELWIRRIEPESGTESAGGSADSAKPDT